MADLDFMDFDSNDVLEDEPVEVAPPSPYAAMALRNVTFEGNGDVVLEPNVDGALVTFEGNGDVVLERAPKAEPREAVDIPGAEDHPMRSFSAISAYLKCPKLAWFRYVQRRQGGMGAGQAIGKVVHAVGMEFALRQKMATGKLPSITEVVDRARDSAVAFKAQVDWSNEGGTKEKVAEKRDDFVDKGIAMTAAFVQDVASVVNPTAIEEKFLLNFDGFVIKGFIDIVEATEDEIILHDLKNTVVKPPAWGDPAYRAQLGFYGLVHNSDMRPVRGVIDTMVYKKTIKRGREVIHLPVVLDENEMDAESACARDALHHVIEGVKADRFPRNPTACVQWNRPCDHIRECFPERAAAIARLASEDE